MNTTPKAVTYTNVNVTGSEYFRVFKEKVVFLSGTWWWSSAQVPLLVLTRPLVVMQIKGGEHSLPSRAYMVEPLNQLIGMVSHCTVVMYQTQCIPTQNGLEDSMCS